MPGERRVFEQPASTRAVAPVGPRVTSHAAARGSIAASVRPVEDDVECDANSLRSLMDSAGMPGPYDFSPPMMYDANDWTTGAIESGLTYRKARSRQRALIAGSVLGLVVTLGASGYLLMQNAGSTRSGDSAESIAILPPSDLVLQVTPVNAIVKVDGVRTGNADDSGRIMIPKSDRDPETLWLEVSAEGYQTLKQPLSLYAGSPEAAIELVRLPYELTVKAEPPQAEIWIDGTLRGAGPVCMSMDPSQPARLEIRAEGYRSYEQVLSVPPGEQALAVNVQLDPVGVMLAVETEPAGAKIFIDGKLRGTSPLDLELDAASAGSEIEIAASAPGHDIAFLRMTVPDAPGGRAGPARIMLAETTSKLSIDTDPPGGRVVIDGRDRGTAPVTVEFTHAETGREVVVDASLDGAYFGRRTAVVPRAGEPEPMLVPMAFSARKVVFLFAAPVSGGSTYAAMDAMAEQIRRLNVSQRFAVIASADEGLETWPGGLAYEAATSEQKVRAFDSVRGLRPATEVDYAELLNSALAFSPTTVWLVTSGEPDREALTEFADRLTEGEISLNVVCATASEELQKQLAGLTGRHRGTLILLGRTRGMLAGTSEDAAMP